MNIEGICMSEFNHDAENFLKNNSKKIYITTKPEELKKIEKYWGHNKPPIKNGRVMINTKSPVELDKWSIYQTKIVKYTGKNFAGEKYTNYKFVLISCHRHIDPQI